MKRAHKLPWHPRRSRKSGSASTPATRGSPTTGHVGEFKAGLDVGEWLSDQTLRPRWNVVKKFIIAPWAAELSQNAAKYAIIDLGQAADTLGERIASV